MMQQKVRNSRLHSLRRAWLNVEALEDRFLPAGPSGLVTAMLDPKTGVLMLQGSIAGNNSVRITPSPIAGQIRVQGQAFTSINAVTFADFALSSITNIAVTFPTNGFTSLTVMGFSIPGNLTINNTGGGDTDTYSITNFNSNKISLTTANSANTITLNAVRNGMTTIATGEAADNITVSAATIGTLTVATNIGKPDRVTLTGSTVGNLSVTMGRPADVRAGVQDVLVVTGNTLGKAAINVFSLAQDSGSIGFTGTLSNNTYSTNAANAAGNFGGVGGAIPLGGLPVSNPPSLTLNINTDTLGNPLAGSTTSAGSNGSSTGRQVYRVTVTNQVFNTGAPAVLHNGSATINLGNASGDNGTTVPVSNFSLATLSGVNDFSFRAGTEWDNITLDTITARQLTSDVASNSGQRDETYILQNATVAGPVLVTFGNRSHTITLNNIFVSVTPIDLALGRQADLTLSLGDDNNSTVTLSNLNVGRNLKVTNGDGDTMFNFLNDIIGQDFIFRNTPGLNDTGDEMLMFTNVKVLNELAVTLGQFTPTPEEPTRNLGVKSVSAQNLTAAFGSIVATDDNVKDPVTGLPVQNSNVYWDQGGNAGYFVEGFDNFLFLLAP